MVLQSHPSTHPVVHLDVQHRSFPQTGQHLYFYSHAIECILSCLLWAQMHFAGYSFQCVQYLRLSFPILQLFLVYWTGPVVERADKSVECDSWNEKIFLNCIFYSSGTSDQHLPVPSWSAQLQQCNIKSIRLCHSELKQWVNYFRCHSMLLCRQWLWHWTRVLCVQLAQIDRNILNIRLLDAMSSSGYESSGH